LLPGPQSGVIMEKGVCMGSQFRLFLDLDGVLADFDEGVRLITGKMPGEMPERMMWPLIARTKGFFAKLPWTVDGRELWEQTQHLEPIILTGVPLGKWAEPQKREWCARELGKDIPVITCLSRHKGKAALEFLQEGEIPVLVDDRLKAREGWLDIGGEFVLHTSARESLQALAALGLSLDGNKRP